jgi:hypothetical protein
VCALAAFARLELPQAMLGKGAAPLHQYLYFCTRNAGDASKQVLHLCISICTFVLVKQVN